MATFLYRVGRSAYAHRWRFIAVWLLLIIGMGTAAATLQTSTTMNFSIPGLESVETQDKIKELFPSGGEDDPTQAPKGSVVIQAPEGSDLTDPGVDKQVNDLITAIKGVDSLTKTDSIVPPVQAAEGLKMQMSKAMAAQKMPQEQIDANIAATSPLSADKTTGIVEVNFDAKTNMDLSLIHI